MATDKARITVYLPQELKDRLAVEAQKDKRSVSVLIEILVLEALEARDNRKQRMQVSIVAQKKRNKVEIRAYIPKELDKLVRSLATLRDETLSAVIEESLEKWITEDQNLQLRDKHNLDEID